MTIDLAYREREREREREQLYNNAGLA